jgi:hypothetical protein
VLSVVVLARVARLVGVSAAQGDRRSAGTLAAASGGTLVP